TLGLVEHDDDDVARLVHREGGGEGGDQRSAVVAAGAGLFRAAGLAADAETRRIGVAAGAVERDHPQHLVHPRTGAGLEHPAAAIDFAWLNLLQRRRTPD